MIAAGITSIDELGHGSVIESGSVTAHMRGLFPLDVKLARLSDEQEISVLMKVRVPSPQGNVQVDLKSVDHKRATLSPL